MTAGSPIADAVAAEQQPGRVTLSELLGRPRAEVLVVGCGNLIRGDDAAGPVLVRLLAERGVPQHVRLVDGGTAGMDVAFAMRGARQVRVVDASRLGVAPGTVHRVPGDEVTDLEPPHGNLHRLRWDQALGFARWMLADDYPEDVEVWLVEGESFEAAQPLTPAVQQAVEQLAQRWCDEWAPATQAEPGSTGTSPAARLQPGAPAALSPLDGLPARPRHSALPSHPSDAARHGEHQWIQAEGAQ